MNSFRFARRSWNDNDFRDWLHGAVYNAVLYAGGMESNGDYMVRLRAKGGGVYIAYWEDTVSLTTVSGEERLIRNAHVRVGSPALKRVSWMLDYSELNRHSSAVLWWCPRESTMPFKAPPERMHFRDWCLYEGVYVWARHFGWNPEGNDGRPMYKVGVPQKREAIVERMLEESKR